MGPLCPCPNSKKPMKKVRGASHGAPLLSPGPRAVPEFPNGQSAPGIPLLSCAKHLFPVKTLNSSSKT
ncbi:unnamed protein product [Staurois parvus]|uniref:Uncharacterized protein n=1 Tax=Staurois parvus TaxID=386267 RepID=A0ABN9AVA6_9NEOB|nr:unnamed protein product [Staurois parvus]